MKVYSVHPVFVEALTTLAQSSGVRLVKKTTTATRLEKIDCDKCGKVRRGEQCGGLCSHVKENQE